MPTVPGALDSFIGDLALLHERCRDDAAHLVEATRLRLAQLVAQPGVLPAEACEAAENIHRVANAGSGRAISVHGYGADIERLGSSINKTFDHLAIRRAWQLAARTDSAWRT